MVTESPGDELPDTPTVATRAETRTLRQKKKVRFTLPSPSREESEPPFASTAPNLGDFVLAKLADFGESDDGSRLYRVRSLGYEDSDDTLEPEGNLPAQFIRRYWRDEERANRQ
jgi:hypothetical protein